MNKNNLKILVIDDEFAALTKMKTIMSAYGTCEVATSGAQSVELIKTALSKQKYFDLITIDIELPDIDGISLITEILREEEKYNRYAVKLVITANSTTSNVFRAAKSHCDGFLVKPVKKDMLNEKLISLGIL